VTAHQNHERNPRRLQPSRIFFLRLATPRSPRLGYGVYARAIVSRLSGEPLLHARNGLSGAARQALDKLGVPWEPTESERAYNEGRSTQIPVNPVLRVKGRFSRRLKDKDRELVLVR
jgi:hypothetical protein